MSVNAIGIETPEGALTTADTERSDRRLATSTIVFVTRMDSRPGRWTTAVPAFRSTFPAWHEPWTEPNALEAEDSGPESMSWVRSAPELA